MFIFELFSLAASPPIRLRRQRRIRENIPATFTAPLWGAPENPLSRDPGKKVRVMPAQPGKADDPSISQNIDEI